MRVFRPQTIVQDGGGLEDWVTSTYDTDIPTSLALGFTCTSGRKYSCMPDDIASFVDQLQAHTILGTANIEVKLFNQTYVLVTLAEAKADKTELLQNIYNIWNHYE